METRASNNPASRSFMPLFREIQYFRSVPLMIAVLAAMAGVLLLLLFQVPVLKAKNVPAVPLYIPILIMSLLIVLFLIMRLEVEVGESSFRYRFFPFLPFWREFELSSIQSAEAVTYRPIIEYGGWGIRYGRGIWAYTVSGNRGVVIRIRNGKTFMLGTKKPDELIRSLRTPL